MQHGLYHPDLKQTLISTQKLKECGCEVNFKLHRDRIVLPNKQIINMMCD